MACRVARFSQNPTHIDLVFCCECDSADLEVFYSSKTLGPHLCARCAHSKVEGARDSKPWSIGHSSSGMERAIPRG